jgi:hypothetical protein
MPQQIQLAGASDGTLQNVDVGGLARIVRPLREALGNFASGASEVVLNISGDTECLVYVNNSGAFNGTIEFAGASDNTGAAYFPIVAYPYAPACIGGTIPITSQPIFNDAIVTANTVRVYSVSCGQLKRIRVRVSAFTSGTCAVSVLTDSENTFNKIVSNDHSTLFQSQTAAVGAGLVVTLPAVAGLRHVIKSVSVVRSATAALTAAATPVVVTTSNLPGAPALTFGADVAGIGIDKIVTLDVQNGLTATSLNTATTFTAPAYVGVIWRINVAYKLAV